MKTLLSFCMYRSKRKTEGEYYYDYGDYGAPGVDALPDSDRVVGSQLCQPCRPKAAAKPGRPDPKLFRNGHVFYSDHGVIDLQSLFRLLCAAVLRPRNSSLPPPTPRIWAHIEGSYWLAKIDDISL
jgi:hypothetical protein